LAARSGDKTVGCSEMLGEQREDGSIAAHRGKEFADCDKEDKRPNEPNWRALFALDRKVVLWGRNNCTLKRNRDRARRPINNRVSARTNLSRFLVTGVECAPHATTAGAVNDRNPATIPIPIARTKT